MGKRVFLIVLDSFGIGALPDAYKFGDEGTSTLKSISKSENFHIPNLERWGIGEISGIDYLNKNENHIAAVGKSRELSVGKDTTTGHWEIAGLISNSPMPVYENGFPKEIIEEFEKISGRKVLCNKPYSGTQVILDYGREHIETGDLIVYTSADSVFQIAAHEDVVPLSELYDICKKARKLLKGEHSVGRVIARPFVGEYPNFTRTSNRHDFSLEPHGKTLLDAIKEKGLDSIAVGKISDIFAERGVTEKVYTKNNEDGMKVTLEYTKKDFNGLCFVNLVDFDSAYGHRNDVEGYAKAVSQFDLWLPSFEAALKEDDIAIITADHGCDPASSSSDHTREYIPIFVYGKNIKPVNFGERTTFADIGATVSEILGVGYEGAGKSFYSELI